LSCTAAILPIHTALFRRKLFTQTDKPPYNRQSQDVKEANNGSEKVEGIPLKRAEGLLLVMDTPKGAVNVTLPAH
jgi:hypothetical protein